MTKTVRTSPRGNAESFARASLKLPFPPSTNRIWRNARGNVYLSKEYKQFLTDVLQIWLANSPDDWRGDAFYSVSLGIYPPPRSRRDADNVVKPVFDALQKAGAWNDDYFVFRFFVYRHEKVRNVYDQGVLVTIDAYERI